MSNNTVSDSTSVAEIPTTQADREREFQRQTAIRRRQRHVKVVAVRISVAAVFLIGWEVLSGPVLNEFFVSKPSAIGARLLEWTLDGTLAHHSGSTLLAMALGFVIGAALAVVLGFVLGRSKFLSDVFQPFIIAMNSLPKLAMAPLFILWFGIGLESKVVMTALVVFFLVFYNTYSGARDTDSELLDVVTVLGANRRERLIHVIIPSTVSWILTGLRLAVPYSLIGAVISEITASDKGLGYLLKSSANTFDTPGTFAAIAVLILVALLLNVVVTKAESINARWK